MAAVMMLQSASAQPQLKGVVQDSTGQPVPFVTICIKGTGSSVVANANGVFEMSRVQLPVNLLVNSYDYGIQPFTATVPAPTIVLRGPRNTDEKVVVIANCFSARPKEDSTDKRPVIKLSSNPATPGSVLTVAAKGLSPGAYHLEIVSLCGEVQQKGPAAEMKNGSLMLQTLPVSAGAWEIRVVPQNAEPVWWTRVTVR